MDAATEGLDPVTLVRQPLQGRNVLRTVGKRDTGFGRGSVRYPREATLYSPTEVGPATSIPDLLPELPIAPDSFLPGLVGPAPGGVSAVDQHHHRRRDAVALKLASHFYGDQSSKAIAQQAKWARLARFSNFVNVRRGELLHAKKRTQHTEW